MWMILTFSILEDVHKMMHEKHIAYMCLEHSKYIRVLVFSLGISFLSGVKKLKTEKFVNREYEQYDLIQARH